MKEDFDPSFDGNINENRLVKLEDMFSDSAYYYFDVVEWESMIEYYLSVLKLDKATKALNLAKIQHPASYELFMKEAELLSEKNNPKNALIILEKLERTYPFDADITLLKGNIHSRFGHSHKALSCFKSAIDKADEEQEQDIYIHIAAECLVLEKVNQAIFWLKTLVQKSPDSIEALYELAQIFETDQRYEEGIEFYKVYLETRPYSHHAWFNLGNLYSINSNLKEAVKCYDFSVVSYEEFSSGWFNKGSIQARLGLYNDAIESFLKTLELEGPSAHTYCNIGECYEELSDNENAIEFYKKSLDQLEDFEDAILGCANCYLELNKLEEAFDSCEKGLKVNPENAELQLIYAEVCQGLEFYKEAKRAYKKALKLDAENWEIFLDYSGMMWENGHKEEAIQIIESGLALHHNHAELNYRSGIYHYLTDEKTKAFNRWNNAFINSPLLLEQIFDFCSTLKSDPEVTTFFEQF